MKDRPSEVRGMQAVAKVGCLMMHRRRPTTIQGGIYSNVISTPAMKRSSVASSTSSKRWASARTDDRPSSAAASSKDPTAGNYPKKDIVLKSENNPYVRSVLRGIDVLDHWKSKDNDSTNEDDKKIESYIERRLAGCNKGSPSGRQRFPRYSYLFDEISFKDAPTKKPGPGADMEAVSIYYDIEEVYGQSWDVIRLKAFIFHFNDGGELDSYEVDRKRCGPGAEIETQGNFVLIRLEKGESITSLDALRSHHRPGVVDLHWLVGISFQTSMGRKLEVSPNLSGYSMKEKYIVPEGQKFRSIQMMPYPDDMDMSKHRFFQLESIPINNENGTHTPAFRPLTSMAHDAEHARLQNAAIAVESKALASLDDVRSTKNDAIDEIIQSARMKVQASKEAEEVRRLQSLLSAAQGRLQEEAYDVYTSMKKKVATVEHEKKKEWEHVKNTWKADRDSVLKDHESFLRMSADLEGGQDTNINGSSLLCKSPNCRQMYKKDNLLVYNKCCGEDCRINEVNCGCDIQQCELCFRFLCTYHRPYHMEQCTFKKERQKYRPKPLFGEDREAKLEVTVFENISERK